MPEDVPKGTVLRMVPKSAAPVAEDAVKEDASPEGLLLDLLQRTHEGWRPYKLVVHAIYEDAANPGVARHIYWSHLVANHLEHLGLLDLAKHSLLTESNP